MYVRRALGLVDVYLVWWRCNYFQSSPGVIKHNKKAKMSKFLIGDSHVWVKKNLGIMFGGNCEQFIANCCLLIITEFVKYQFGKAKTVVICSKHGWTKQWINLRNSVWYWGKKDILKCFWQMLLNCDFCIFISASNNVASASCGYFRWSIFGSFFLTRPTGNLQILAWKFFAGKLSVSSAEHKFVWVTNPLNVQWVAQMHRHKYVKAWGIQAGLQNAEGFFVSFQVFIEKYQFSVDIKRRKRKNATKYVHALLLKVTKQGNYK